MMKFLLGSLMLTTLIACGPKLPPPTTPAQPPTVQHNEAVEIKK